MNVAVTIGASRAPGRRVWGDRRRSHVMEISDIIWLSLAGVLAACLLFRHWLRARRRPPETHWTGHGIDVTGIADRVQRVRNDFAVELPPRPHDTCHRKGLLASARRAVGRLSYFRRRAARSPAHTDHDTETHAA